MPIKTKDIALDIEKAFGKINILIRKLIQTNISTHLAKLTKNYFCQRTFQVKINSSFFNPHYINLAFARA